MGIRMLRLTHRDQEMLDGGAGQAVSMAMRVLTRTAEAMGAEMLLDISSAHIDSCLYHGRAGVDFAERLRDGGARVVVPTTLNVGSVDLLHPELYRGSSQNAAIGRRLMQTYIDLGAAPTFTCAPYQLEQRPGLGDQIAWAESNAIVFANSVLGARTERYGDFLDACAAVTGRAPAVGLHLDDGRRGGWVLDVSPLASTTGMAAVAAVIGLVMGSIREAGIPVIVGLDRTCTEDDLKAIGASAASAGAIAMFHAVGLTPEASTLEATGIPPRAPVHVVTPEIIRATMSALGTGDGTRIDGVALGTPHYSADQLDRLSTALAGRTPAIPMYVNTNRAAINEVGATAEWLRSAGVTLVVDTCTYITPIMDPALQRVMTDSGKWAHYAPANLGVEVAFGSLEDCVESAVAGKVVTTW